MRVGARGVFGVLRTARRMQEDDPHQRDLVIVPRLGELVGVVAGNLCCVSDACSGHPWRLATRGSGRPWGIGHRQRGGQSP